MLGGVLGTIASNAMDEQIEVPVRPKSRATTRLRGLAGEDDSPSSGDEINGSSRKLTDFITKTPAVTTYQRYSDRGLRRSRF